MNVETFLLCATYKPTPMGKLNILGAFDALKIQNFPLVLPQCSVAVRIRLQEIEQGAHKITIHFIDDDGKFVIPPLEGGFEMNIGGNERSGVTNIIIGLQKLNFTHAGEYALVLALDGKEISIILLQIRQIS